MSSSRRSLLARAKTPIESSVLAGTIKKVNRMIAKAAFQDLLDAIKKMEETATMENAHKQLTGIMS